MLRNNNEKVLRKMSRRSLAGNKRENGIIFIAIVLSAFLMFCILTVGATYFQMQRMQNIRMMGMDFDGYIYGGFTREQLDVCRNHPLVAQAGVEGLAGSAQETDKDSTLNTAMIWADETQWKVFKQPALQWVQGSYPVKENEVMPTQGALEDFGLEDLGIGDTFTLTYSDKNGQHRRTFTISGVCREYSQGNLLYMSKAFFDQSGFTLEDYGKGFLYMKFTKKMIPEKVLKEFQDALGLKRTQPFFLSQDTARSMEILGGMAGLVLVICISAYLLIYNILYISVSGRVRYYGLLQTVGMTERQVRHLIRNNMVLLGVAGILTGIVLGAGTCFFIVPGIVKSLGIRDMPVHVTFHPAIVFLSAAVAGGTISLGGRKPARLAAKISPIEAVGYRACTGKRSRGGKRKGNLLWHLAKEQLRKDKRKALTVVLSLGASLSVFLCLVTLIASQGPRNIVSYYMEGDFIIHNDTINKAERQQWTDILDEDLLGQITQLASVKDIHSMYNEQMVLPWEPDFAELWMSKFYQVWLEETYEDVKDQYKEHPENFSSYLTGIDAVEFDYLNRTLEEPVDREAFEKGECCIIFRHGLDLELSQVKDKKVSCYLYGQQEKEYSFRIAGLTDESYYANMVGIAPTIIVSDVFLKSIVEDPYVSKVNIQYKEAFDYSAENEVKALLTESPDIRDFSWESKIEELESVEKAQGNMMGIGIGIALLLAIIGIMNYVNTVWGNIQNRLVELSIMESVGMTERQAKKMLLGEGMLFAAGSVGIMATAGLGCTYVIYQAMNSMGIVFHIPILPVCVMVLFITVICGTVPYVLYNILVKKKSIVERIRDI